MSLLPWPCVFLCGPPVCVSPPTCCPSQFLRFVHPHLFLCFVRPPVSMRFVWPPVSWSIIFQFNFSVLFFSAICKWKLRRMFIRFCQKWIIQSLCSIYFLCKLILILFYTVYDESLKFRQTLITGKLAAKRRCQKNRRGGGHAFFLGVEYDRFHQFFWGGGPRSINFVGGGIKLIIFFFEGWYGSSSANVWSRGA